MTITMGKLANNDMTVHDFRVSQFAVRQLSANDDNDHTSFKDIFHDNLSKPHQNVNILHNNGAKDGRCGGDNCSYKMHKAPVKPGFLQAGCLPVARPTVTKLNTCLMAITIGKLDNNEIS